MKFKIFGNNAGFSLVTIMVAVGVFAILSSAMMTLFANMQAGQGAIKFRTDADNVTEEIRHVLSAHNSCTNTLAGTAVEVGTTKNVTNIRDDSTAPGVVKYTTGQIYGDRTIRLIRMDLKDFVEGSNPAKGVATLALVFETTRPIAGPDQVLREIKMGLELNAGVIQACAPMTKMSDGIWQRSTLNTNDIYYNAGNVGVGIATPTSKLDVNGNIRATGTIDSTSNINLSNKGNLGLNMVIVESPNTAGANQISSVNCPAGFTAISCHPTCYDTEGIRYCHASNGGPGGSPSGRCLVMCQGSGSHQGAICNGIIQVRATCVRMTALGTN